MSWWQRVTTAQPCPVCDRAHWCGISDDGKVAICMRVESKKPTQNGGWLHRLREDPNFRPRYTSRLPAPTVAKDYTQLNEKYEAAADDSRIKRLARELGVAADALRWLHVGWDGGAFTFPMRDATRRVIGIRRRFPGGRKLSIKGGREGLFIPDALPEFGSLLLTEGATDTAAMLTLGLDAIGRPSCQGGARLLVEFCKGRPVAILADADKPGRIGADALANVLRLVCPSLRVIRPPESIKDARQWLQRGGTRQEVEEAIAAAETVPLEFKRSRRLD